MVEFDFLMDNFNRNVKGGRNGERLIAGGSGGSLPRCPGEKPSED